MKGARYRYAVSSRSEVLVVAEERDPSCGAIQHMIPLSLRGLREVVLAWPQRAPHQGGNVN